MEIKAIQIIHPKNQVDNVSLFKNTIPDIDKFVLTTGINQRYVAPKHHSIEDYFIQGIQQLNIPIDRVDVVITVTQTPSKLVPSISNYLHQKLSFRVDIRSFDLISGCSGYTEALVLANQLFQLKEIKNILICNGDFSNQIIADDNKTIQPLFSDIAAITWLTNEKENHFSSNHFSYGEGYQAINSEEGCMTMNGLEVYQFSTQYVATSIQELLDKSQKSIDNIDKLYFHQANLIINKTIIRQLKVELENVPFSIQEYGNSSSASIPVTLAKHPLPEGKESLILLSGFGVGFRICNVLMKTSNFTTNISTFED